MSYQSAEKLAAGDPKTLRDAIEPRDLLGRQPDADQPFSWVSGSGHAVVIRHPHVKLCIFFLHRAVARWITREISNLANLCKRDGCKQSDRALKNLLTMRDCCVC